MQRLNERIATYRSLMRQVRHSGKTWRRLALLTIALGVLLTVYWPAQAAMLLSFFRAESTNSSVLLNWGTAREINVEGFKIYCKLQDEPESAYHIIGTRIAKGGPDQPAVYDFNVTEGVFFGEQYCFRLEEVTTDGLPGEQHDICGYGPGITPTPSLNQTIVAVSGTLTPLVVTPPAGFTPPPTLVTPTPIGQSPVATPTPDIFATATLPGGTATPTQQFSPQDTPSPTATQDPFGASATVTATETTTPTPTEFPTPTATQMQFPQETPTGLPAGSTGGEGGLLAGLPLATAEVSAASSSSTSPESPIATPTETVTPDSTPATTPDSMPALAEAALTPPAPGAGDGGTGPSSAATPTLMYIVVTATSTPETATAAPSLTPLPTVTSTPEMGLLNVLAPSSQNMMVMMLCLIFLSATGLGSLGLVTAVLYFRSQSQRRY